MFVWKALLLLWKCFGSENCHVWVKSDIISVFLSGSISCRTYLFFRLVFQFTFMFWHDKLLPIDGTLIIKWKQVFAFLQQSSTYLLRNFVCLVTIFEESCHVVKNWKCDHHQNWKSVKKKLKFAYINNLIVLFFFFQNGLTNLIRAQCKA